MIILNDLDNAIYCCHSYYRYHRIWLHFFTLLLREIVVLFKTFLNVAIDSMEE